MFYAILAPLGFGIANALSKITGNSVGYIKGAILLSFSSSIFLFALNIFFGTFTSNLTWIVITILFGIYGYLPLVFFIKSISLGKAGIVIPIIDLSIIFPIILSFLFLNQKLSIIGLIFVLILLAGVMLMSLNFSDLKNSSLFKIQSGVLYAIIASILWGVGYFLWSFSTKNIGPIQASFFIEVGVLLAALFHLFIIEKDKIIVKIPKNIVGIGFLIGLLASFGDLGTNLGIQNIGVPLTMAITGARPAVGALTGYLVFKEKLTLKQIMAIIIIMIGVVGVSLYK